MAQGLIILYGNSELQVTCDYGAPEYESFCFDIDHIEEKSSGSTTSHSDLSLFEYESFYFDLSIDPLPPADRSDSHLEEFVDDYFYFDLEDIKIPSGESKVHIEVLSALWGNRLSIPDGSLPLSRTPDVSVFKKVEGIPEVEIRLLALSVRTPDVSVV
ncbi:hypothetical protein Tco_1220749 [Tanacetum coccineum]